MLPIDLTKDWSPVPETSGIEVKPLSGELDEAAGTGFRTRYVRIAPGGETFAAFTHPYWEEAALIEGEVTQKETGVTLKAPAYVIRPPGTPHGPLISATGCLMIETQYFAERALGRADYLDPQSHAVGETPGGHGLRHTDETNADRLMRLMRMRQSCRAFRPDSVPDEVIRRIIETARWTASWSNIQPWDELIVTRPETTARLSAALLAEPEAHPEIASDIPYPNEYPEPYLARRREVGFGLYAVLGIKREDRAARHAHHLKNFRFFGAPHVALVSVPRELGPYGVLDIGAFVSSFLLAAEANGVATVAQAALAQHSRIVRDLFDLPKDRDFVCGISFGYPMPDDPANRFRSSRIEPEALFHFA